MKVKTTVPKRVILLSVTAAMVISLLSFVATPAKAVAPLPECTPEISTSSGYTIVKFVDPGECTWASPSEATTLRGLIVGGGGGGGGNQLFGGGGGGGGFISFETLTVSNQVFKIKVGAGGVGGGSLSSAPVAQSGETSSVIIGSDLTPTLKLVAPGGGAGGAGIGEGYWGAYAYAARGGGSGGGSGGENPASVYGRSESVTAVLPNTQTATSIGLKQLGSDGSPCSYEQYGGTGGGGGGAGSVSGCYVASPSVLRAGHGGDGYPNNILGAEYFWAGGGGGGAFIQMSNQYDGGNGGLGGGGGGGAFAENIGPNPQPRPGSAGAQGFKPATTAQSGVDGFGGNGGVNTGGGGGGGMHPYGPGGRGGSGIVVLRYLSSATSWLAITEPSYGVRRLEVFDSETQIQFQSGVNNEVDTSKSGVTVTATISSGGRFLGGDTATATEGVANFGNLRIDGIPGTTYKITYSSPGSASVIESVTLAGTSTPLYNGTSGIVACGNDGYFTITNNSVVGGYYCTGSMNIPSGVTAISNSALTREAQSDRATGITSLTIPDSVTEMGFEAISETVNLTSLSIGSGITSIPDYSFSNISYLTSLVIPANVTAINNTNFNFANRIKSLTISSGISFIHPTAFAGIGAELEEFIYCGTLSIADHPNLGGLTPTCPSGTPAAAILTQPTGASTGFALSTQPVIRIVDSATNTITSSNVRVLASIKSGTGVLSGTTSVAAVNGVATFTNLVITGTPGAFTLAFTPVGVSISITSSTITISPPSSIATLSALTLSSGTLSPTFSSSTTSYTASVSSSTSAITITPTRTQANATITVNGTTVTSGVASGNIPLNVDENTITVIGTAQDGASTATYTITITRPAPPTITIGTTDFEQRIATNVGVSLIGFDESLSYQATVKFVNATTNADVSNGILTATKGGTSTIPGYSSYSATKLGFKGTYAQIAAALISMTWTPQTVTGSITMRIGVASMPGTTEFYYDANSGHYYKYVSTALPWETATAAAEATTLFGLRGYLAEINSAAENSFIGRETTATNVWIGASDRTTEGTWIWAGATNRYPKPVGSGSNSGRTAAFHSWANGEPNDWPWHGPSRPEREDCAVTNWQGKIGMWNDWPCLIPQPYLIEFGGRPGETSTAIGATLTTTVSAAPPMQYDVDYDPMGGSSTPTSPSRIAGERFAAAGAISKEPLDGITYQFAGWYSGYGIYKAGETITMGFSHLELDAVWVELYEVTYLSNGGTFVAGEGYRDDECDENDEDICRPGEEITLNSAPTRAGYTFVDWKNQSGASVVDSNNAVAGIQTAVTSTNYIFSASWTPITYTITYTSSGSSAPTQSPLEEGDTFTIGSAGTRTGFEFSGWSDGDSVYFPNSEFVVGTSNIALTAQWTAVFAVAYSPGLGSGSPTTETSSYPGGYELVVGTDAGISRSGFTFSGWSDGTTTYQAGDIYTLVTSNVTLTAQWTADPIAPAPPAPTPTSKSEEPVTNQVAVALALKVAREALQIDVAKNQKTYREMFASLTTANSSISTLIPHQKSGVMINAETEGIISSQSANVKIPAEKFSLYNKALDELKGSVRVRVTSDGISVTPVNGFTGIVVVPVAATVNGVETVVLNKVVINPVPPKAQSFAPTEVNKSSITWAPSTSQTTGYLVTLNGKEICQTSATTCPVAALIGPKSVVTITALGNDQTVSTPVVIPYVATKPIPALKVNFAVGSSILSTAQKNEIRSVARVISTQGFTRLVVSGFTDSNGSLALNKKLSEARAKSVAVFMRTLLPEIQIKASAFGPTKPIASNKSKSGQAQNRRTQIATW